MKCNATVHVQAKMLSKHFVLNLNTSHLIALMTVRIK